MKVLYDSQIFGRQDYGGISRYFSEIIKRLSKNGVLTEVDLAISHNYFAKTFKIGCYDNVFAKNPFRNYLYMTINSFFGIPKIIFSDFDILHPTYYDPFFLHFISKKPFVITAYDMVHELFSNEYLSLDKKFIEKKRLLFNKASHIIAISQNTKNDIVRIYNINPQKVSVIYLANSLKPWNKHKKLKLPPKYLLYVGHRWIYKNFDGFIKSVKQLLIEKDISVVCAGGNNFSSEETKLFVKLKILDRVIHMSIKNDMELSEYYGRAEAFVYTSKYEGFGIPILEAFANKCPVICSNTSSFPEVALGAAVYFNPDSEISIKNAIKKLVDNNILKRRLKELGARRLLNFSWDRTARQTAEVYKKVIGRYE